MVYLFKKKNPDGYSYWCLGENKRVNGVSKRIWEKYVGTADTIKKMIDGPSLPIQIESLSYGLPASMLKINQNIDFVSIVDKYCNKRTQGLSVGEHVLMDIINRIEEQQSHNKLGEWFYRTVLRRIFKVKHSYLSSQGYWNHWQYLTENRIEQIQTDMLQNIIKDIDIKQLFYDPTNFTTFIANDHKDNPKGKKRHKVSIANYGKAKNGLRGLRQINLALLVTKDYGIPLWHKSYDGNMPDVSFFKTFIQSMQGKIEKFLKECKSITLIFDKGNNSITNIKKVDRNLHFYMLGSLAPSEHKDWLKISLDKFNIEYETAKKEKIKAHYFRSEVFGKQCNVVITYNEHTAYNQKERTNRRLKKGLAYFNEVNKKLNNPKWTDYKTILLRINTNIVKLHANDVISWDLKKDNKKLILEYTQNKAQLEYLENSYGKTILFTDNDSLQTVEIIKAYHDKYIIEQKIKQLKNRHMISYTPQYCWTDDSIRAHSFTCVMALLFTSLLKKEVKQNGIKMSDEEIISELREIRQGLVLMPKKKSVIPMIEKMSDTQKKLYNALNLGKMVK